MITYSYIVTTYYLLLQLVIQSSFTSMPTGFETAVVTLIKGKLIQIHPWITKGDGREKESILPGELWQLPDKVIDELGSRSQPPSPYSEDQVKRIELTERAIKIIEPLNGFGQYLQNWAWQVWNPLWMGFLMILEETAKSLQST